MGEKTIAGTKTPQDSMVRLMKGPSGSKVEIMISRDGNLIPFELTRDKIPVHCVDAAFMLNESTGYIKLSKFSRSTYKEFSEAAEKLLSQGIRAVILIRPSDSQMNSLKTVTELSIWKDVKGLVRTIMQMEEDDSRMCSCLCL